MTLEEALREIERLKGINSELRTENASLRNANKDLKGENEKLASERDTAVKDKEKAETKLGKAEKELGDHKFVATRGEALDKAIAKAKEKNPRFVLDRAKAEKFLSRATAETLEADVTEALEMFGSEGAAPRTAIREGAPTGEQNKGAQEGDKADPLGAILLGRAPASSGT